MTDKPTPTDAELEALLLDKLPASKHYIRPVIEKMVAAMQAAIDKWGQPAQAAEPLALLVRKNSWRDGQWEAAPPNSPSYGREWASQRVYVYTTPQPTHAQAGAVTDAQVLAAVRVVSPSLFRHGLQPLSNDGANTAAQMRKEADTVRKMLEAANGIKGGQHGTE